MNIKRNTNTRFIQVNKEKERKEFTCYKKTYRICK